jgi:hypothetical protein
MATAALSVPARGDCCFTKFLGYCAWWRVVARGLYIKDGGSPPNP